MHKREADDCDVRRLQSVRFVLGRAHERSRARRDPGDAGIQRGTVGPVAVVYRVGADDEAVALGNDSPYSLGGAVFGSDDERVQAVAYRLETGMVVMNHPTASEPNVPFGGVKHSGFGRELSHLGILEFANRKLIATTPTEAPIRDALG